MKSFIVFLILSSLPSSLSASEIDAQKLKVISPSDEDILKSAIQMSEHAISKSNENLKEDCDNKKEIEQKPKEEVKEAFCFCDLNEADKNDYPVIGKILSEEIDIRSGNDNFLHGALNLSKDLKKIDGDDRGRTFDIGSYYRVLGSEGEASMSLNSTGFGRLAKEGNQYWSDDGKRYLDFLEVNTLNLHAEKYFNQKQNTVDSISAEVQLDYMTDEGIGAQKLQDGWHKAFEGMDFIQYKYRDHLQNQSYLSGVIGLSRKVAIDLSRWKCVVKADLKLGASNSPDNKFINSAKVNTTVTHQEVPWVVLQLWAEEANGVFGRSGEQGLKIQFPIKGTKYTVTPYLGVEKHQSKFDREFSSDPKRTNEIYHVLGINIRY